MIQNILWGIVIVVLILWLLGFFFKIFKGLINILLAVAAVIIIINLIDYFVHWF
jgi:hypothetical protein